MSSTRIHSINLKDRNMMVRKGYGDCNFYTLSPVGIRTARQTYYNLRRSGLRPYQARDLVWTLIFTTKCNILPMNTD